MNKRDRAIRIRLGICLLFLLSGFGILIARTLQLQFWADTRVAKIQERQGNSKEVLSPARGTIFDRNGKVLAVNLQVPSVFADPGEIKNPKDFSRKAGAILSMNPKEIYSKIKTKTKRFVWLKRKMDPAIEARLNKLDLTGLHILHEGMRLYPDRQLASQLIGFVGVDGQGLEGIEYLYEKYLRSGELVVHGQKDARGRQIFTNDTLILEAEPGADLHITIDSFVQHEVEKELFLAAKESGSKHAMGIVMDPNDGRVLAMASYPALNPNRLDQMRAETFRNRPVEDLIEPGSTMKIFTMAAALENNLIQPNQSFFCQKGSLKLSGKVIRNHEYHDWLTPGQILKYSDNLGTARISLLVGPTRLYEMLRKFGFGTETGLDLSGEPKGMLKSPKHWKEIDLANISFGQGVGVTAIQLASAFSAVANGGFLVKPYILDRVQFHEGRTVRMEHPVSTQPIVSSKTIETLKKWMEEVTKEGGTGRMAALDGYRTAGKTGTSQKIDPATHNYSSTKVVSSFIGFAPVANPKLVSLFIFDEPTKADFGSTLAAPVFKNVMEASLAYLGVPQDLKLPIVASANIPSQERTNSRKIAAKTQVETGQIPDMRGLTVREVLSKLQEFSVDVKIVGSGVAVRQFPKPGERLSNPKKLEVVFESSSNNREET